MNLPLVLTYGSDPELMIVNRAGKIMSAVPLLKKDKHDPIDLGDGIKVYADNVLAEASFRPVYSVHGLCTQLKTAFDRTQKLLGDEYKLLPQSAHIYDEDQLKDPGVWESGCNPNLDVYSEKENAPANFTNGLRTGSFHLHIGNYRFKEEPNGRLMEQRSKYNAVRLMDVFVGCASVIFDKDPTSSQRRALYGKAGEFRKTFYGIEYRVLGNYALRSPLLVSLVFDLMDHAMGFVEAGKEADLLSHVAPSMVRDAINEGDVELCKKVLTKAGTPSHLMARITAKYNDDFQSAWELDKVSQS